MSTSMSRRDTLRYGTVGAAAVALPVAGAVSTAGAAPAAPDVRGPSGPYFDVRRYGARGDGERIDSPAINRAIETAAAAGGGTVYFPAGTYASYSIRLKSNITLYLDHGATLLGATPTEDGGYDDPGEGAGNPYQDFGHSHWRASLIWGEELENIGIRGPGVIDGQGLVLQMGSDSPPGTGQHAIALKLCRNVVIQDITIVRGGHLTILPTGVDNLTIHNVKIDSVRDGINVDCCRNVRISDCTINTPFDDAIVLKSSYALGFARVTENVTIANCMVSGYDIGSVIDGTFTLDDPPGRSVGRIGRIKFGTESNGGFRNIAITNVVFAHCLGLALETVDGGLLEDITISNITMHDIETAPLFLRLGARMRGPDDLDVGKLRRVNINNLTVYNADPRYPSMIVGIPGHAVEDVQISDVRIHTQGGLSMEDAVKDPPENEAGYPEPNMFGVLPAYGMYVRHADGVTVDNVHVTFAEPDTRPAVVLDDVRDAEFHHVRLQKAEDAPTFVLRNVTDFEARNARPVDDRRIPGTVEQLEL